MKQNKCHKYYKRNIHNKWSYLALAVLCFMIVWIGYYVISFPYINSKVYDKKYEKYKVDNTFDSNLFANNPSDSIDIDNIMSTIKVLEFEHKVITERQADLVNDVRQETNNNIDKLNLWLTFAIGIISIFGIFIPLIAQHHNNDETRNALRELEQLKIRINQEIKINCENIMKNTKRDIEILKNEVKQEITKNKETIREIESKSAIQDFRSEFMSISLGFDDKILSIERGGNKTLIELWARSVEALSKVVEFCKEETSYTCLQRRIWLIESFVLVSSFIIRLKAHSDIYNRGYDLVGDKIRFLLHDLEYDCDNRYFWQYIYSKIDDVMMAINRIRIDD